MSAQPKKASRGRPATGKTRPHRVPLDVSPDELAALQRAAEASGKSYVAWIRDLALAAAGYKPAD